MWKLLLLLALLPTLASAQEPEAQPAPLKVAFYAGANLGGFARGYVEDKTEGVSWAEQTNTHAVSPMIGAEVAKGIGSFDVGVNLELGLQKYAELNTSDTLWNFMATGRYRIGALWFGASAGLHLANLGNSVATAFSDVLRFEETTTAFIVSPRMGYDFDRVGIQAGVSHLSDSANVAAEGIDEAKYHYTRRFFTLAVRFSL